MSKRVELLIIDPQVDFCDPSGALYVSGANDDMDRLAGCIKDQSDILYDIHVTLDSHHAVDVAHPIFWRDSTGKNPDPFTIISSDDIKNGKWNPTNISWKGRMVEYVEKLEADGKYPLCIWPPHCLIGSVGHTVYPSLFEALSEWEKGFALVDYVTKGSNIYTEHYSAVQAEVPDPEDPSTQINTRLVETLMEADVVLIAGEAGSHCLANTVRDIANAFGDDSYISKLVLLEDATSPVTGFESNQDDFIKEMSARGMIISSTVDLMKKGI